MLVIMKRDATDEQISSVIASIESLGYQAHSIPGATRTAIGVTGNNGPIGREVLESLPGVIQAIRVTRPYKLVSREVKPEDTVIEVGGVRIGGPELVLIAGPCSVESRAQIMQSAAFARAAGARILRGGAFKPRTSPYAFQGLGEAALKLLAEARQETGLPVVSEVLDSESIELARKYVDMLQIGARNMQNYVLLKQAARTMKPILLKRGPAATLEELLNAAEYILAEGNYQVVLCERGIRGFSDFARNTLDLTIVPVVKELSHLPIITDPSHGTGKRNLVIPLALASVAVGADGLIIEMHPDPDHAFSDGYQSLYPQQLSTLAREMEQIAPVVGRGFAVRPAG
ncbi:3-deoxy-7-phosphoheptulonate synthase [candidate division KSB1 bacterium]|nr:3-deoxy-7-phosphoheptulonate synthase [candidate division KSB1 bacterium]